MVRFGPGKSGKEGMVDIDDPVRVHIYKLWGNNLHITGQDNKINAVFLQQRKLGIFCLPLACTIYRDMVKRKIKLFGYWLKVTMVTEDKGDFNFKFPGMEPAQQVVKTVIVARNKNGHPWLMAGFVHSPFHVVHAGNLRLEFLLKSMQGELWMVEIAFKPHKKYPSLHIHMLVQIYYISSSGVDEAGNRTDYSRLVRTMYKERCFQTSGH